MFVKPKIWCILLVIVFVMSGFCGCAKMTDLTKEEADAISGYVTMVIGKFNTKMGKGLNDAKVEEIDPTLIEDPMEDETEEETQDVEEADSETSNTADVPDASNTKSLTEILGIPGVEFRVKDIVAQNDYQSNEYFAINPANGKVFLVVKFEAKNTTGEPIEVDMSSQNLRFSASLDGASASSEMSVLPNDICTFKGEIPANGTVELVSLFQFGQDKVSDVTGVILGVRKDGTVYQIAR